jgi:UDP-glucose 4-epimerase
LTPSEQICDYLYAGDAAEAILNVVKNQLDGIYNIGSGNGVSVKEIVTEIKNKINTNLKIKFGAKPYSSNQIMHMEANIQKIKVFTGWVPTTSFSNGISRTVDSIIN